MENEYLTRLKELDKQWKEAVTKESSIREAAFLPITLDIAGIEVKHFTPIHYIYLDFIRSPFLHRKTFPTGQDLIDFLWVVSPYFKHSLDIKGKDEFAKKCLETIKDFERACEEVDQYLFDACLDMPLEKKPFNQPSGHPKIPYMALICNYIDVIANQYGWKDEEILQMPFARIYQYIRAIEARNGKDAYFVNRLSDPIMHEIRITMKNYRASMEKKQ